MLSSGSSVSTPRACSSLTVLRNCRRRSACSSLPPRLVECSSRSADSSAPPGTNAAAPLCERSTWRNSLSTSRFALWPDCTRESTACRSRSLPAPPPLARSTARSRWVCASSALARASCARSPPGAPPLPPPVPPLSISDSAAPPRISLSRCSLLARSSRSATSWRETTRSLRLKSASPSFALTSCRASIAVAAAADRPPMPPNRARLAWTAAAAAGATESDEPALVAAACTAPKAVSRARNAESRF